jgi:histone H3/H4
VDEMRDVLQDFTVHMFELFSEGDKIIVAERDDVKAYIALFIEDEDKEMINELILPSKDIERAIINISEKYNVRIKKDVIYLVHMFLESVLAKIIDGAKMINEIGKTKRLSGKELKTAYKIYML